MAKDIYHETINKIKATDSFKANTIIKMQNELKKDKQEVGLQKHKNRYKRIGAIVASCAIFLSIGILTSKQLNVVNNDVVSNLPKLTLSNESDGMGFEGLMAYKIDELKNENPWTIDSKLTSMPVFKNISTYSYRGSKVALLTGDEMIKKAKEVASIMSLKVNKVYTQPTKEEIKAYEEKTKEKWSTTPTNAIAVCNGVSIDVESNGYTRISYEPSIRIPSRYSFMQKDINNSQAKDTLSYLIEKYSNIVDMKSPALSLYGDYSYEGKRTLSYDAYESDGDLLNKILGFNFNTISFSPNDNGDLWIIDRHKTDLSKLIGNYPIITVAEARRLLIEGHYITTVPEDLPNEKYIAKSELIYRNSSYDKVLMPYYKFLVEMPTMKQDNGLKTFGAFYIPAVKSEYITNMPKWNGEFN